LDLLFTTADEVGGVGSLIRENVDLFPTEYMVVASQKYIIQPPGSGVEFICRRGHLLFVGSNSIPLINRNGSHGIRTANVIRGMSRTR
jgi:hypothetical protein